MKITNRKELAEYFHALGYKMGAEIGVRYGDYSFTLCDVNPDLKLLCIDPWKAYFNISDVTAQRNYEKATERLKNHNATLMRMSSKEASRIIKDGSLDFVYIDGLHDFNSALEDLTLWTPKVRYGGIVAGHDYKDPLPGCKYQEVPGVKKAVNFFFPKNEVRLTIKSKEDPVPSFFWIKNNEQT